MATRHFLALLLPFMAMVSMVPEPVSAQTLRFFSGFGHGAVLQREMPVPVWGWSPPGDLVTISFSGKTASGRAGADGMWKAILDPMQANATPSNLVATSTSGLTATSTNILVGEVWFFSGQSNMAFQIGTDSGYATELARPPQPLVRHYRSDVKSYALTPQTDVSGT